MPKEDKKQEQEEQEAGGQQSQDASDGGEQQSAEGQGQATSQDRTFTQGDVNRIIDDRLKRERQKFSDYDALKERAEKWAEHEEAQKSELERAQDAATKAEAERDAALSEANDRLIQSAFVAEAAKAGVAHPADAFNLADIGSVTINDGGEVEGAAEAIATLVEAGRLVMTGKPQAPKLDGGAGSGERQGQKKTALTPDELEVARKLRITPEDYQKSKDAIGR
jgi:hypothetical protein